MNPFDTYLERLGTGTALSQQEMILAMGLIMDGKIEESKLIAFLTHLADRGETADEITGGAKVLRSMAHTISSPPGTIDCCGTGGDGLGTYNVSTAVALVAAGAGVPIAKHGNRAASSKSGAADVLEALGVNLALTKEQLKSALRDLGFCFLMAPGHHPAMRHVVGARRSMKRRTIFNLMGPLSNPAGAKRQLVGVWDRKWTVPMAQALQRLGADRAWVVHGEGGIDEITLSGNTYIAILENGEVREEVLTPDDFGLPVTGIDKIIGGSVMTNATALISLLAGHKDAYRNYVLANAAAVLVIADKAQTLQEGVALAEKSIDSGKAMTVLNAYKEIGR